MNIHHLVLVSFLGYLTSEPSGFIPEPQDDDSSSKNTPHLAIDFPIIN